MNDPTDQPIDIEEQRKWLIDFRTQHKLSWSELSRRTGIPQSTIAAFGGKGYGGNEQQLAEKVYRHRQFLTAQAQIEIVPPKTPGYFDTPTSRQLWTTLQMAQRGRIVVAALGPGLGKTTTARHYAGCFSNVFYAVMRPSTSGVNNMQMAVLSAMGEKDATGTPQKLTDRILAKVTNLQNPLLILDETQHLSEKALEEIRGWNDHAGLGIALLGNEGLLMRLEGGSRRIAYAQLYSRVSLRIVRPLPLEGDVDALAAAWDIVDDQVARYLRKICMLPGGLRSGTMALELASMLAMSEQAELGESHLVDAWAQLSSRSVLA